MLNIQAIREATSGCNNHIHFNNAGASLPTDETLRVVIQFLQEEAEMGGYEIMEKYAPELEAVYSSLAKMINASRDEIALFQSATNAWVAAFSAIPFKKGDIVLCSEVEYVSNYLNLLRYQKELGIIIKIVPSDENGLVDLEALEDLMNPQVKLIAITHIPTNGGLVNPAEAIGKIANAFNCLYLLDACQSAGQLPLDVNKIGCDFLAATGRKYMRAPRGTGFLFCRKTVVDKMDPFNLDMYSADWLDKDSYKLKAGAQRFETFENNKALQIGMGAAVNYYLNLGPELCYERIQLLAGKLRAGLTALPTYECMDLGLDQCGIVTFIKKDMEAGQLKSHLFENGIYTSLSAPMGALIDAQKRNLPVLIRASLHYYNTQSEVDELLNVLSEL